MKWDNLPNELINKILSNRRYLILTKISSIKIQSIWRMYRTKVLISRFKMLKYLKEFKKWNHSINIFIERSKL